ncbi:MFS transporter [Labedella endophytica]|uniref:MFS transporter n=1 Tax=Labedella endophytica TaxID=1523160 RepID=A0A3S0X7P3_9MICO|nr:MFS transporter [Labedella endophytica]RUR01278.1 MFS transporter [Labedella endophytica]
MLPVSNGPTTMSSARIRFALLALAVGGFGIGTTEFAAMGLLPQIATDLFPALSSTDPEQANARAGLVISAYALGVVVGAPTINSMVARFRRDRVLVVLAIAFTLMNLAAALAPSFELILLFRFLAGIPHGAYFGLAALVAAKLMGPGRRAQGVALAMAGLTVANVIGVPLATVIGQAFGWRVAFVLVAVVFAVATVAIWFAVPRVDGSPEQTMRRELTVFRNGRVWFALITGCIVLGGLFAVYTYLAPITTELAGLPEGAVPWVLATVGLGMTIGNLVGGRVADWSVMKALFGFAFLMLLSLAGFALTAQWPVTLFLFTFAIGFATQGLGPTIQTRLMDVAGDSQAIAAGLIHSALNVGNALGAYFGGVAIAAGLGYSSPAVVGMGLTVAGIAVAALGYVLERRGVLGPTR